MLGLGCRVCGLWWGKVLVFCCGSLLVSCTLVPTHPPASLLYWPKAPAVPRLVYETTLRSIHDLSLPSTTERLRALVTGSARSRPSSVFIKPYDIAALGGLVIVSDTRAALVHVFDIPRQRVFKLGGRGAGQLIRPLGVAIDAQQNIYVADASISRILAYDRYGHFQRLYGKVDDFSRLSDVAVSPKGDMIYGVDRGGVDSALHRVSIYAKDGALIRRFGQRGKGMGEFNHPIQLAVTVQGDVLVLDAGNFRVQVFSALGEYKNSWGKPGNLLGNLARPRGIAVDRHGYVYVTDSAYQNLQIFTLTGQLLLPVGQGGRDAPGQYLLPAGVAVDETMRIYIVDQLYKKVDVFRLLSSQERQVLME